MCGDHANGGARACTVASRARLQSARSRGNGTAMPVAISRPSQRIGVGMVAPASSRQSGQSPWPAVSSRQNSSALTPRARAVPLLRSSSISARARSPGRLLRLNATSAPSAKCTSRKAKPRPMARRVPRWPRCATHLLSRWIGFAADRRAARQALRQWDGLLCCRVSVRCARAANVNAVLRGRCVAFATRMGARHLTRARDLQGENGPRQPHGRKSLRGKALRAQRSQGPSSPGTIPVAGAEARPAASSGGANGLKPDPAKGINLPVASAGHCEDNRARCLRLRKHR